MKREPSAIADDDGGPQMNQHLAGRGDQVSLVALRQYQAVMGREVAAKSRALAALGGVRLDERLPRELL